MNTQENQRKKAPLHSDEFLRFEVRISSSAHPELWSELNRIALGKRSKRLLNLALMGYIVSNMRGIDTSLNTEILSASDTDSPPAKIATQVSQVDATTSSSRKAYSVPETASDEIGDLFARLESLGPQ